MHQETEHQDKHLDGAFHHGHSHAIGSKHSGGHHLLQVEDLSVSFRMYEHSEGLKGFLSAEQREVKVIENLHLSVHEGELVAVVGASGSGKTLLADSIMGIYEPNSLVSGRIWFDGMLQTADSLARLRGRGISFIPQRIASLDPLMKVGAQMIGICRGEERRKRQQRCEELLQRYGLPSEVMQMYPHELSGGMARRVLLCSALMESPKLIIADEPTPGLDLNLATRALDDLRNFATGDKGVLLITHDIELALNVADRIAVFKDGTVVEETGVQSFREGHLKTEYAQALRSALPEYGFKSC